MTDILTTAQVLRHVADNLDAGRPEGHGLQFEAPGTFKDAVNPIWGAASGKQYRLKPRTRMLNGFEVPAPMDVIPEKGMEYWSPCVVASSGVTGAEFTGHEMDYCIFHRGFMFATKEDAIANFKAICGEDPNK